MGNETKKTDEAVKKIASEEKTTPVIPMGRVILSELLTANAERLKLPTAKQLKRLLKF